MNRLGLGVFVVISVLSSTETLAQDGTVNATTSDALKQPQVRIVNVGAFADRPSLKVDVEAMMPTAADGQIHFYGGPLQTYLNLAGKDTAHDTHLPFGATFVLPINRWRLDLFGGIGGAFATFRTPYAMTNSWIVQTSMGTRVALDNGRHIWVGTTASHVIDFADKQRQWVTGTADLTLRFGK